MDNLKSLLHRSTLGLCVVLLLLFSFENKAPAKSKATTKVEKWIVVYIKQHRQSYWGGKIREQGQYAQLCLAQKMAGCQPNSKQKYARHGVWRWWWSNGKLKAERNYRNGMLYGRSRAWYINGSLRIDETYRKGKLQGKRHLWFSKGGLKSSQFFKNGILDGKAQRWWWNGKRASSGKYLKGNKIGVWHSWYSNGTAKEVTTYANGIRHGLFTRWWFICRPGSCGSEKVLEGFWVRGKKKGRWRSWFINKDGDKEAEIITW